MNKTVMHSLCEQQIEKYELNIPANWKGDPRDKFEGFLQPLMNGTEFFFKKNATDSSRKILEIYRNGSERRIMGISGNQDMSVWVFFNPGLYNTLSNDLIIPENQQKKRSQPHIRFRIQDVWDIICALTGKKQYMVGALKQKKNVSDFSGYEVIKKIHPEKEILWIRRKSDGKLLVRKEYTQYNKNVFERLCKVNISGIPKYHTCEERNGKLYTVEDYIEGRDLNTIFEAEGLFDEKTVLDVAIKLCDILEKLHALNPPLIHRDIKPSNIIFTVVGDIVLIDFNASKEYKKDTGVDTVLLGTQYFAAPEQLIGYGASDARTDIYGIGATMNYLLTGMPRYSLVYPGALKHIIEKCTDMTPNNRYGNIKELKKALLKVKAD